MENIVVTIDPAAKDKLDGYIDIATGEISGLGTVLQPRRGEFHISDIHLFEQQCSGGSTDISIEDVSKSLVQALTQGLDPHTLKLWWHSHANMKAFWSGTDHSTAKALDNGDNGWMLCLVQNKKGEYKLRLDVYDPTYLYIDDINLRVLPRVNALREQLVAEVRAKVKPYVITVPQSGTINLGNSSYYGGNYDPSDNKHAPGFYDKERTVWNPEVHEWEYPTGHKYEMLNKSFEDGDGKGDDKILEVKRETPPFPSRTPIQHGLNGLELDSLTQEEILNMTKEEKEWYDQAIGVAKYPSEGTKLSRRQMKKLRKQGRL